MTLTPINLQFGTISAIDLNQRTLLDSDEIMLSLSRAREVLGRAADFEGERIVSWGRLTRDEMISLFAGEPEKLSQFEEKVTEEQLLDRLLDFDQLLARPERYAITLYYSNDGQ